MKKSLVLLVLVLGAVPILGSVPTWAALPMFSFHDIRRGYFSELEGHRDPLSHRMDVIRYLESAAAHREGLVGQIEDRTNAWNDYLQGGAGPAAATPDVPALERAMFELELTTLRKHLPTNANKLKAFRYLKSQITKSITTFENSPGKWTNFTDLLNGVRSVLRTELYLNKEDVNSYVAEVMTHALSESKVFAALLARLEIHSIGDFPIVTPTVDFGPDRFESVQSRMASRSLPLYFDGQPLLELAPLISQITTPEFAGKIQERIFTDLQLSAPAETAFEGARKAWYFGRAIVLFAERGVPLPFEVHAIPKLEQENKIDVLSLLLITSSQYKLPQSVLIFEYVLGSVAAAPFHGTTELLDHLNLNVTELFQGASLNSDAYYDTLAAYAASLALFSQAEVRLATELKDAFETPAGIDRHEDREKKVVDILARYIVPRTIEVDSSSQADHLRRALQNLLEESPPIVALLRFRRIATNEIIPVELELDERALYSDWLSQDPTITPKEHQVIQRGRDLLRLFE